MIASELTSGKAPATATPAQALRATSAAAHVASEPVRSGVPLPMPQATSSRWRFDLLLVAVATASAYVIGSALELHEALSARLLRFERWQADEIPLCLTVLACGFAWYVWRRRKEVHAQLALREAAEARIADLLAHNRELTRRMIAVQESERVVLARELHDELGQSCAAIRAETAFLCGCAPDDRSGILGAARRADVATQTLYQLLSGMLRRLRPAQLDALGLTAALDELCDAWEERTGLRCVLDVDGEIDGCGDPLAITIYRVVQEALTNVGRHAHASRVVVRVQRIALPSTIALSIEDDGVGMDLSIAHHGLGLLGAAERVAASDGSLSVASSPGNGVAIAVEIPWIGTPQPLRAVPTGQVWKVAA